MNYETTEQNAVMAIPKSITEEVLRKAGLTVADLSGIESLTTQINPLNPNSVAMFGKAVGEQTSAYADELLGDVRSKHFAHMGSQLAGVLNVAQSTNMNALTGSQSKIPVIGPFIDRVRMTGKKMSRQFESSKEQIDKLLIELDTTQEGLSKRNETLDQMFVNVKQEYVELGKHIIAGRIALEHMNAALARMSAEQMTAGQVQEMSDRQAVAAQLSIRIGNLEALQQSSLQTLPQIRVLQATNANLVDKYNTIKVLTIPAWKRQFVMALGLNESKNAAQMAEQIDDFTNDLLVRGADLLHKNAVSTAKSSQRLPIDVKTLEHVQNMLIKTVNDFSRIQQEGEKDRAVVSKQLESMQERLKLQFTGSGNRAALAAATVEAQ